MPLEPNARAVLEYVPIGCSAPSGPTLADLAKAQDIRRSRWATLCVVGPAAPVRA